MAFKPQKSATFEIPADGTYVARIYRVIDLGTQIGKYAPQRTFVLGFEFPDALASTGDPMIMSKFVTPAIYKNKSGAKSAYWQFLDQLLGREMDEAQALDIEVRALLDMPCTVEIGNDGFRDQSTILSVTPLPKGKAKPAAFNPSIYFELDPELYNDDDFMALPNFMKNKIKMSDEYRGLFKQGVATETPLDRPPEERPQTMRESMMKDEGARKPGQSTAKYLDDDVPF